MDLIVSYPEPHAGKGVGSGTETKDLNIEDFHFSVLPCSSDIYFHTRICCRPDG